MNNQMRLEELRKEIYIILQKEIDKRDYCLLDLPNYYNPGDQLIWEGDEQLVTMLSGKKKYSSSVHFFNSKMISEDDCILLQGGGGFGDLYYKHQKFREYVVKKFPKNKIIILPSTIYFSETKNLQKSIGVFSRHNDLIICARDNESFKFLRQNFKNNKCYLVPDTAFSIKDIKKSQKNTSQHRVLFLCRNDKEKNVFFGKNSLSFIKNIEILDWPTQKVGKLLFHAAVLVANRFLLQILKFFGLHWDEKYDVYGFIRFHSKERQIVSAIRFLSQYDLVITTRLHGHILSCLLGIPNILVNNNYGKNKNFYDTWMINNPFSAYYANSPVDIRKILTQNFPDICLSLSKTEGVD